MFASKDVARHDRAHPTPRLIYLIMFVGLMMTANLRYFSHHSKQSLHGASRLEAKQPRW